MFKDFVLQKGHKTNAAKGRPLTGRKGISMKTFDENELKQYDGSEPGKPIYFAFNGKVYDATDSPLFIDGMHFEHFSGCDLTEFLGDAPHSDEVITELKVVGEYKK